MTLRELADQADREVKENPVKPIKKSAADIEALRWREMFQAALSGFAFATATHGHQHDKGAVARAAMMADEGLVLFYNRYRQEGT